jgi:hypothetical protein
MLKYNPNNRIGVYKAMCHPIFKELRELDLTLPNGNCISDLFNFSEMEKQNMGPACREILIPSWYDPTYSPGIHIL